MRNTTCLLLVLIISGCATQSEKSGYQVAADAREGKFSLAPFEWDGTVSLNETVSITNKLGDLRVRSTIDNHVVVSAQIQRFSGDDRDIEVIVENHAGGVQVRVSEIPLSPSAPGTERGTNGHFDGRVDMALLLPDSSPLIAETRSGLLQVKSYKGAATLTTDSGTILVSTPAAVVAHADSGEVQVHFRGTDWANKATITSRTGRIMVTVPQKASLAIEATTRGELSTLINAPITKKRHTTMATLGSGSGQLTIRSATGPIELKQDGVD